MSDVSWPEHRAIQERFDTVRLADRLEEALVTDTIDVHAKSFIEARDMFFLSTVDPQGRPTVNPNVGLLFVDWRKGNRLRFHGTATVAFDDPLLADFHEAQFVVRVRAEGLFSNCPRYVHRMEPIARSEFVPREDCVTPVPAWKSEEWVADALPEADPARDPNRPVA